MTSPDPQSSLPPFPVTVEEASPPFFLQRIPLMSWNSCPSSSQELWKKGQGFPVSYKNHPPDSTHLCNYCRVSYCHFPGSCPCSSPHSSSPLIYYLASAHITPWKQMLPRSATASLLLNMSETFPSWLPPAPQWHSTLWTPAIPACLIFLS